MRIEQQIELECCAAVSDGIIRSLFANLTGLVVAGYALFHIAEFAAAALVILLRLTSIGITHFNGLRIRGKIKRGESLKGVLTQFYFGAIFGALCWGAILYPVPVTSFPSFAGITIISVMTLGLSMISLTFAPLPKALFLFSAFFGGAAALYILLNLDILGPLPLAVLAILVLGVLSAASRLSRAAHHTARVNVENVRLSAELQETLAKAEQLSRTDALTGLANRRAFEEHVEAQLVWNSEATLILLDLDHFKRINDEAGHAVGDTVLAQVGDILSAASEDCGWPATLAARIGGEEFAVFIPGVLAESAETFAESLRCAIGTMIIMDLPETFSVSASLGMASRTQGETAIAMQKRADKALYEAKNGGRDQLCLAA